MKRPDGVVIIGIYQLVIGLLGVLASCFLIIPIAAVASTGDSDVGIFTALGALALLFCSAAGGSILSLIAGWGLLQLKEWARWLTIVIAAFSLLAFPIGTIIGALVIWYLLTDDVKAAFESGIATVEAVEEPIPDPSPMEPAAPEEPDEPAEDH